MSLYAWILLLSLAFIWGASFYFIEVGLFYLDPFWLVSLRLTAGALALYGWLRIKNISLPRHFGFWQAVFIMGIINNIIPFSLIAIGQQYVTGGMASILNANTAFMGVIMSGLFLTSEPARWYRILGVMIGVFGVAVAIGLESLSLSLGSGQGPMLWGQIAIILATLSYACAGVWGRLRLTSFPALQGAAGMLICSALLSVVISSMLSGLPQPDILNSPSALFQIIVGIGVFGTALAYPLYFRILAIAGSSNLLLVTIIVPVFALILDAILLNQFVSRTDMIGFVLVAIGLVIMDGRLLQRLTRRPLS